MHIKIYCKSSRAIRWSLFFYCKLSGRHAQFLVVWHTFYWCIENTCRILITFLLFQIKARQKVAITVLIFVAVFAICFAPLHAFMLFFYFTEKAQDLYNPFWHYLRIVGFCLCYINSCVNPVALYFVSGAFRKHFNR